MKNKMKALTVLHALFRTFWPRPSGVSCIFVLLAPKALSPYNFGVALQSVSALQACPRAPQGAQLKKEKRGVGGPLGGR